MHGILFVTGLCNSHCHPTSVTRPLSLTARGYREWVHKKENKTVFDSEHTAFSLPKFSSSRCLQVIASGILLTQHSDLSKVPFTFLYSL